VGRDTDRDSNLSVTIKGIKIACQIASESAGYLLTFTFELF